jgi:hypothetical protein
VGNVHVGLRWVVRREVRALEGRWRDEGDGVKGGEEKKVPRERDLREGLRWMCGMGLKLDEV